VATFRCVTNLVDVKQSPTGTPVAQPLHRLDVESPHPLTLRAALEQGLSRESYISAKEQELAQRQAIVERRQSHLNECVRLLNEQRDSLIVREQSLSLPETAAQSPAPAVASLPTPRRSTSWSVSALFSRSPSSSKSELAVVCHF
jgi:hypothetical protein